MNKQGNVRCSSCGWRGRRSLNAGYSIKCKAKCPKCKKHTVSFNSYRPTYYAAPGDTPQDISEYKKATSGLC